MTKTIDFDAFRSEQKVEPVVLVLGGKSYEMPAALPAALALDIMRLREVSDDTSKVKPEDLLMVGAALFGGADQFRTVISEARVTMDELPDFVKFVLDAYTSAVADPNPAPQKRERRASPSSATGR